MIKRLQMKRRFAEFTQADIDLVNRPWIHRFATVDLWISNQSEGSNVAQIETQGPLFRQIRDAVKRTGPHSKGLMPTCDDGYFALYALSLGAEQVHVVDVGGHIPHHEPWHLEQSALGARLAGRETRFTFEHAELSSIEGFYDFGICANVLENFPEPSPVLEQLRAQIRGPLVLHSATVYPNIPGLFQPRPERRPWGSRFSHDWLVTAAVAAGWTVINERVKQMPEDWPSDRNLTFLHCI